MNDHRKYSPTKNSLNRYEYWLVKITRKKFQQDKNHQFSYSIGNEVFYNFMTIIQAVTEADGVEDSVSGRGGLSYLDMFLVIVSVGAFLFDMIMDIELVLVYWRKMDCELLEKNTSCAAEANVERLMNTFENMTPPRNELD